MMNLYLYILVLIAAFLILSKSASYFVGCAVNLAEILRVPKLFIGVILVAFATTAPEFAVSVQSAYLGYPEIALGNAVGSVICDGALAMALAAIFSVSPITIDRRYLLTVGTLLFSVGVASYFLSFDGLLSRTEGFVLVTILFFYIFFISMIELRRRKETAPRTNNDQSQDFHAIRKQLIIFILALSGVIFSSRVIVWSAINIAEIFVVPEVIVALSIIAIGTSLPEISTCIAAALKKHGDIAVGNILGADIFNILWIIGVSALVNPIEVEKRIIHFAFPWMLLIIATVLISMRIKYQMGKLKGFVLITLYVVYLFTTIKVFY